MNDASGICRAERVERGRTETGQDRDHENLLVAGCETVKSDPETAPEHKQGSQPPAPELVADVAEERLRQRRRDRVRKRDQAKLRVAETEFVLE